MEQTVTIPAAEYEELLKQNAILTETVAQFEQTVAELKDQLAWLQRQVFGPKSERVIDTEGEVPDLPGLSLPEPEEPEPEEVKVPAHKRRRRKGKGTCTLVLPDYLERVERVIDVPEDERTLPDGTPLVRIGEDKVEQLAHRPGEYFVLVTIRPKYAAPNEPNLGVVQEPAPPCIIEGSKFDASFMAHLVVEKFAFHLPLYRIQEKLAMREIEVTRQTLSNTLRLLGERVIPLYDLMAERALASGYLHVDETTVKLMAPGKCVQARIWIYLAAGPNAPPYHIYQFTRNRNHDHVNDFLKDFSGHIHADAFGAYEDLDADPDIPIQWAACWAHARRKFEEAKSGNDKLRLWVLRKMRHLFRYERVLWRRDPEERLRIRQEREKPIVDELFTRLKQALHDQEFLPQSKFGKAVSYMLKRPENFTRYLDDPTLRLDNNPAERALRKLTIGRKNWMFIGSRRAGIAMAALLSLIQTCRALDINPQAYLEDLFRNLLDHPASRLADFLPDVWKANHTPPKDQ